MNLLLALSTAAWAAVAFNVTTRRYDVVGDTVEEINASIRAQARTPAPDGQGWNTPGIKFGVKTHWEHDVATDGSCKLSDGWFVVEIVRVLPNWPRPKDLDPDVLFAWKPYVSTWRRKVDGQRSLAKQIAVDLDSIVSATPPRRTCATVDATADREVDHVLAKLGRAIKKFDSQSAPLRLVPTTGDGPALRDPEDGLELDE